MGRVANELIVVALAYGLDKGKKDKPILAFDLGGDTLDTSLLKAGKDGDGSFTTQVRVTSGDNRLDGDD